mgnify:FL=1
MPKETLLALVDAFCSTLLLLVARFVSPADAELVKAIVLLWQPIVGALLVYWAYQQHLITEAQLRKYDNEHLEKMEALYAKNKE